MPLRSDWSDEACSIARGIDAVGDPWTLLIVRELLIGHYRFDRLRDRLGIAENTLSARLSRMTVQGLVTRVPYLDGRRTRYEYRPTLAAAEALPILHAFSLWAERHATRDGQPHLGIVCQACSARSRSGESCSSCGIPLTTDTAAWIMPSHDAEKPIPLSA